MSTTKQPPQPTDFCSDCGILFFDADTADRHWRSKQHRYARIDRAIATLGLAARCVGYAFPLTGRWWLDA